eukprot:1646822-Pyramimonas_sp.AAC.1
MSFGVPEGSAPPAHSCRSPLILDHRPLPFGRPALSKSGLHLSELAVGGVREEGELLPVEELNGAVGHVEDARAVGGGGLQLLGRVDAVAPDTSGY